MPRLTKAMVMAACCALSPSMPAPTMMHSGVVPLLVAESDGVLPGRAADLPAANWALLCCGIAIAAVIARRKAAALDPHAAAPADPIGPDTQGSHRGGTAYSVSLNAAPPGGTQT